MSEAALERQIAPINLQGLLGLMLLPLLAIIAFGVGTSLLPPDRTRLLGISIATMVLGLSPIMIDISRAPARRHLLLSFFSLAYLTHFAMPAFVRYLGSEGYGPETLAEVRHFNVQDVFWGEVALFVGLLTLLIGYSLPVDAVRLTSSRE